MKGDMDTKDLCPDCEHNMLASFALDDNQHASMLTRILDAAIHHALEHDHTHPNPYVRVRMILTLMGEVCEMINDRLITRCTTAEASLAWVRAQEFHRDHTAPRAEEQLDAALDTLPAIAKRMKAHTEPVLVFPIDPNAVKN